MSGPVRRPTAFTAAEIAVAAPPELPPPSPSRLLTRVVPLAVSVAALVAMVMAYSSGGSGGRGPTVVAFPIMMLASLVMAAAGRGRRGDTQLATSRVEYLGYLSDLRQSVMEIAAAQHTSLWHEYPDPNALWTLIGGPRMWERRPADTDFCLVRVGVGIRPLAARLVVPAARPAHRSDPVTATALRRFVRSYSTLADAPLAIPLREPAAVLIDGDAARARGVLRAMVCQLAVLHAPDELLVIGAIGERNRSHWDWLKWLPHNQHPHATDASGSVRMVYPTLLEAQNALPRVGRPQAVVIADLGERVEPVPADMTILAIGTGDDGAPVTIKHAGAVRAVAQPDAMNPADAVACARRLAGHRVDDARRGAESGWPGLLGIGAVHAFDPITLWRSQHHRDRLCVPIGTEADGTPVRLDIKEPAENGMGPHGLCIGATGSGKSELLRTIALGMAARNSPAELNLLLIDFKGGATFLDLARLSHVSAVITNLADEAPLVARMQDALAGEMNRRQQLLRAAGNFVSVAAYAAARRAGAPLSALPTLFVIVDEFSELLTQHPEFADTFVAIGRLGRSLGMHLLLASQRLDEGRLRGLDAHLSYRMCLKTLSAGESRSVLGTSDAYELPNTPGAGYLWSAAGELVRFRAAFVSGPLPARASVAAEVPPAVRLFGTYPTGDVTRTGADVPNTPTVLHAILDRLSGQGPPAHQVWLPPLGAAPALDTLLSVTGSAPPLTVPIGMVDRPFEQSRTPLTVDLSSAAGHVAIVGAPKSGKSTALCTLITALAVTHDPGRVQFYCLDFGGGTLASVRALPHVGAVAGRNEPQLVWRMIAEMESVVRAREAAIQQPMGDVFLVVDGWATLRHEFEALEESITALAGQGLSFGVHVVLSASRWAEIRPSLKDQIGTRIELRLGDPADSELDRKQAQHVPTDQPGRGLSSDGRHMVIALPRLTGIESNSGLAAPPIPLLPLHIDRDAVVSCADEDLRAHILLGLEERRLRPVSVDFERHAHLLILGDNACGKTAVVRMLCREIVRTKTAAQARLFLVDFRRTLLGVVDTEHLDSYAPSPAALGDLLPGLLDILQRRMPPTRLSQAQLRANSWWSGPDLYVVVDDYDLVVTAAGNPLSALLEYLPYARDLGLHLIVVRRSGGAARALFEPLLAGVREMGCMGLMMSGQPDEGVLLGSSRPVPLPPGRGVLITRPGDEQLIQVAWSPIP